LSVSTSVSSRDSRTSRKPVSRRWRVVDIVVASVLGVASGVIFWLWDGAWPPLSGLFSFTPGFEGLLSGGWLFAGVLGGLVIRKPGAALYTEILAAIVEMLAGNQFGFSSLPWGILEGLGAEVVFAIFLYRHFTLGVSLLAGAVAGLATGLLDTNLSSQAAYAVEFKGIYIGSAMVSGAVIGGLLSWLAVRGLAATGALSRFASGRATQNRV